jgi:hypothetical protein
MLSQLIVVPGCRGNGIKAGLRHDPGELCTLPHARLSRIIKNTGLEAGITQAQRVLAKPQFSNLAAAVNRMVVSVVVLSSTTPINVVPWRRASNSRQ